MRVPLLPSKLKVGDVLYVKSGQYDSEWQGWPMVVEKISARGITMRYQLRVDGTHNNITYDLQTIDNYLESL